MSVWFCIPSARPAAVATECLDAWRSMGYRIALLRQGELIAGDLVISTERYLGWAASTNMLVREVMERDLEAQWFVGGGDDYLPDLEHSADEIAAQCTEHFSGTYGVMQCTGDRWGSDDMWAKKMYPDAPAYIDRIAGSPWMGREFCQRAWKGQGPMHPGFHHMHGDECLTLYAEHFGIYWRRRDLTQLHNHWGRPTNDNPSPSKADMPAFLAEVNSRAHWDESKALLNQLRETNFSGWEPL